LSPYFRPSSHRLHRKSSTQRSKRSSKINGRQNVAGRFLKHNRASDLAAEIRNTATAAIVPKRKLFHNPTGPERAQQGKKWRLV
jgi:hypothetical protein